MLEDVRILARRRRNGDGLLARRAWRRSAAAAAVLTFVATAAAESWQPVDDLRRTAETFMRQELGASMDRVSVRAANLDPRMQLPRCEQPLEGFLQRGAKRNSRMVVGVRCVGARPWKVYVTVDVLIREPVVVAARSLPRGHILSRDDLRLVERDVATLTAGYLSDVEATVGRHLKHQLIEGRVLTPRMLTQAVAVRRGQTVTLTVRSKTLAIRMEGKALTDGSVNERIKVENSTSRRVVEGIVRGPEQVEVLVF